MDRTIKVTGKAKLSVAPDTINVVISLESKHEQYIDAVNASSRIMEELQTSIVSIGYDKEDLKTSSFYINPHYENVNDNGIWRNILDGYEYCSELVMTIPNDNDRLSKLITCLTSTSVEPRIDLRYTVENQEIIREKLLESAILDCANKAKVMAKAAGVTLGEIINMEHTGGNSDICSQPVSLYRSKASDMSANVSLEINANNIELEDSATVIWEINGAL